MSDRTINTKSGEGFNRNIVSKAKVDPVVTAIVIFFFVAWIGLMGASIAVQAGNPLVCGRENASQCGAP